MVHSAASAERIWIFCIRLRVRVLLGFDMLLVLIHVNVVVNKKSTDAARHGQRLLGIDGLFALLGVCLRWRISYCCASA